MKKLIYLSFFILASAASHGQDIVCYNYLISKAEYDLFKGEHEKAIGSLEKALSTSFIHQPLLYQYLFSASCSSGKYDKALFALERMMLRGASDEYINNTVGVTDFKSKPQWERFQKEYDSLKAVFRSSLDVEYVGEISVLFGADQLVRSNLFKGDKQKRSAADSLNFIAFEKLVNKKGIPGKASAFGLFGSTKFFALLLHFSFVSEKSWNYVQKTAMEMYSYGILHASGYAMLIDRYHSWNRVEGQQGLQQFGQWDLDEGANFQDINTIDERRVALGLLPLQYSAELRHKNLPAGYKMPDAYKLGKYSGCK
jgi:tetratricopeptide (TPR) repeat protein